MSSDLQPYLISEFKTGLFNYLKPWRRPQDAFEPLQNAYVYRGVLQKRNGSTQFGNQLADANPVMGIMQRINESTGAVSLVVNSTENAYLYSSGADPSGGTFTALTAIGGSNSVFYQTTITGTGSAQTVPASGTIPTWWNNLVPSSITISATAVPLVTANPTLTGSIKDDGSGNFSVAATGIFSSGGTVNYTTGAVGGFQITLTSTFVYVLYLSITATTTGDYFTGNNTNFFNWTNWQPTSPNGTNVSVSYLYMTNNVDPVTLFDGTNLSRPIFYTNSTFTNYIVTTLDLKVYQNRFLMFRPTLYNASISGNQLLNQSIYFSALFNPFNFINNVAGNGGQITPATGDIFLSSEVLRDGIVLFFTNSTWILRYSGLVSPPYTVVKLNASKTNNAPYCTISYDERCTSMGSTGLIACDGNYVQRYDVPIIDYYENEFSQEYYAQTFSYRYDNLNQTWMLYVSQSTQFPIGELAAPGSDSALIYNFVENTWATYTFPTPMTCLGGFFATSGLTWEEADFPWEQASNSWSSYSSQESSAILLAGDVNGYVYWYDNEDSVADDEEAIENETIATGDGGFEYSGTIAYPPIIPLSFIGTGSTETFTDNGHGGLVGDMGGVGTINYESGTWFFNFGADVADTTPITADYEFGYDIEEYIVTNRWNPIVEIGQKTQFCYIDVYYSKDSTDSENPVQLTLNFYVNNSGPNGQIAASKTLTLDGPPNDDYAWKRIYTNLVGEFIQIEIDSEAYSQFEILGFILWAKPSGRLTMP